MPASSTRAGIAACPTKGKAIHATRSHNSFHHRNREALRDASAARRAALAYHRRVTAHFGSGFRFSTHSTWFLSENSAGVEYDDWRQSVSVSPSILKIA